MLFLQELPNSIEKKLISNQRELVFVLFRKVHTYDNMLAHMSAH